MALIPGSVPLTGVIAPTDSTDTFPVIDPQYGVDGLRNVNNIQEMLAIPPKRRRLGMMVGVGITGSAGSYYYLASDTGGETTAESDWRVFQAGGSIVFFDEANNLGSFSKVKFTGSQVFAQADGADGQLLNVFIPSPTFASHYNTQDSPTTNGLVSENFTRRQVRVSQPTTEGNPFKAGDWAATSNRDATNVGTFTFTTAEQVTGQGGNATVKVEVYNAANIIIAEFTAQSVVTAPPPATSQTYTSPAGPNEGISVTLSQYADDSSKKKARISVTVNIATVFQNVGESGGRCYVKITNKTDTATDGGGSYVYTQPVVFYDANPSPSAPLFQAGSANNTIDESTDSNLVLTKHLSGVEYYILNSSFRATVPGILGLNLNTQGRAPVSPSTNAVLENFKLSATNYGILDIFQRAWAPQAGHTFSGWTEFHNHPVTTYQNSDIRIGSTNFRYRGANAKSSAQLFDPWNQSSIKDSVPLKPILVDTFTVTSTIDVEDFDDEARRLNSTYQPTWDSSSQLTPGQACVVGSCLVKPNRFFLTDPSTAAIQANLTSYFPNKGGQNPDYSGSSYINADALYYRSFSVTSTQPIPSFTLTFAGNFVTGSVTNDLAAEHLRITVRRIESADPTNQSGPTSNPLFLHGALYNSGDFDDGENNGQIRLDGSTASQVRGTFGSFNAKTGILVEIAIRNDAIRIDRITFAPN